MMHQPAVCPHCGAPSNPRLLIAHIQATVAAYYGIPFRMMTSEHRDWQVSHPRQIAMYLAAELTPKSYTEIARRFNRDHTTVLFAMKAVQRRMLEDAEIEADILTLRQRLMPVDIGDERQKEPNIASAFGKEHIRNGQEEMAA